MQSKPGRRVFDYMEGYVTCAVYSALERIGKLDELASTGLRPKELGDNEFLTEATFRYLAQRGLVRLDGDLYHLTDFGRELYDDRGYLVWLSGGYGEALQEFGDLLTGAQTFGKEVDRDVRWVAVGTALAGRKDLRPYVMGLLQKIEFNRAADLGCGNGQLLIALCNAVGGEGIGVDISADACAEADHEVAKAGLTGRIQVVQADARDVASIPGLEDVQLVMTFFFLHEVFENGYDALVDYLQQLCGRLPAGAHVLTAEISPPQVAFDSPELVSPEYTLTQALMEQDLMNEAGWREAFAEGGFEVVDVVEADLPETRVFLARKPR